MHQLGLRNHLGACLPCSLCEAGPLSGLQTGCCNTMSRSSNWPIGYHNNPAVMRNYALIGYRLNDVRRRAALIGRSLLF